VANVVAGIFRVVLGVEDRPDAVAHLVQASNAFSVVVQATSNVTALN
jgi:hypothetical protein